MVHDCDSSVQRAQLMWTALERRSSVVLPDLVCWFMAHAPLDKRGCGADSLDEAAGAQTPVWSDSVVNACGSFHVSGNTMGMDCCEVLPA